MEETQTLCTEEIEIKTDMELSSCSSEKDEKADTRYISFAIVAAAATIAAAAAMSEAATSVPGGGTTDSSPTNLIAYSILMYM
jgi:hypothetical protein